MNTEVRSDKSGGYWIDERPVYPGHPITCALMVLRAYPHDLEAAWAPYTKENPWNSCESHMDTPTAGGNLSAGCWLIEHVLDNSLTVDAAIQAGDVAWVGAGGHKDKELTGQVQADRLKPQLREALVEAVKKFGKHK